MYLKAPVADASDRFGTSVAANGAGTTIAVGAPLEDGSATGIGTYTASNNSAGNAGVVYVY